MRITWTDEQRARRGRYRQFGVEHVAPGTAERDRAGEFHTESWKRLAAEGFWTAHLPPEHGGAGGSLWDFLAGLEGLAAGADDSGFVLSAVAHAGLLHVLSQHGTDSQRRRLLPPLVAGALGATAATEPAGGSHVAAVSTRAKANGPGSWLLTGQKAHITNAPEADVMLVVGRLEGLGKHDITLFVLERGRDGLRTGEHEDLLGQRTSPTGPIYLADVPVTAEDIVGEPGNGLATLYSFLAFDRLMYGIVVAAQLEAQLPTAIERTSERQAFGTAIGNHEYIQDKIVTMRTTLESSRYLAYAAADALVRGDDSYSSLASCAKLAASEGAVASAVELVQIFGHLGYDRTHGVERRLRDAVAIRIAGGTSEMQKKNIYKDVLERFAPGGGGRSVTMAETIEGQASVVVEENDCAVRWGNEALYVLSTPAILGAMEKLCVDLMTPRLAPGEMTVGVDVQLAHMAPTPMGDTVTYRVTLIRDGRNIAVEFTATDSRGTVVSSGTHRRAVIDRDRFLAKLAASA